MQTFLKILSLCLSLKSSSSVVHTRLSASLFRPLLWFLLCRLHALLRCSACLLHTIQFPSFAGESQFLFLKPWLFLCSVTLKVWSCGHELINTLMHKHGASISAECAKTKRQQYVWKYSASDKTSRSARNVCIYIQYMNSVYRPSDLSIYVYLFFCKCFF